MAEALSERVLARIEKVAELYHRLLLIVAPSGSGKTAALQDLARQTRAPLLNLNLEVSRRLLDLTVRQRALQLPHVLQEIVGTDATLVLLDNIEILTFLEALQPYTSPGKLKNFRFGQDDVLQQQPALEALQQIEALQELIADLGAGASYLATAEAVLPPDHAWVEDMKNARDELVGQVTDPAQRSAAGFRPRVRRRLADLKKGYIQAYLALHLKARLGVDEDRKKGRLLQDERLQTLRSLTTIDLMPRQHFTDFQNRLAGLKSCFALTEQELEASPECPHCRYRPVAEPVPAPAGQVLRALDDELDEILAAWTRTLLGNLADPTTREQLELLKPDQRDVVKRFADSKQLPDPLDHDFIQALQEVLRGLAKVVVTTNDLRTALLSGGSPATLDEMKKRFGDYLDERAKGADPSKVRIVLE